MNGPRIGAWDLLVMNTILSTIRLYKFVDPDSGAHMQGVERSWLNAKMWVLRKMRGEPNQHLQSHLDLIGLKRMRKSDPDLFI